MLLLLLAGLVLFSGCKRSEGRPSASGPKALAPLAAASWLVDLEVPGFGASRVAVPLGSTRSRPVVVALHGDFDRPEWPCGSYRDVVRARAIVLCLRGRPLGNPGEPRFGLSPVGETRMELRAALRALKARFGAHVAQGAIVLAALGPAVEQALALALEEPSFFAHLVLVDGSGAGFSAPWVRRFADGGGRRVLFLCTRVGCGDAPGAPPQPLTPAGRVLALRSAGVDARLERVPSASGLDGELVGTLKQEWPWLIAEDPRWKQ